MALCSEIEVKGGEEGKKNDDQVGMKGNDVG